MRVSPCDIVANMMDGDILVSSNSSRATKFFFLINTLEKSMNLLILPLAMG